MARSVWLGIALAGCAVGGGESQWELEEPAGVWASLGSGDVDVRSEQRGSAFVRWDGGGVGKPARPRVVETPDGWLEVDAGGLLGGGDLEIFLPEGVTVEVFVDRGDIEGIFAAPADITACVGAGSIDLTVPPGPWDLQLDGAVGSVDSTVVDDPDAAHRLHACVGAGGIEVRGIPEPSGQF